MSLVKIGGRDYRITGVDDPRHLEEVARCVDEVLHEIMRAAPDTPARDASMLAALNLASELVSLRQQIEQQSVNEDSSDLVGSRVQAMIDLIDSV